MKINPDKIRDVIGAGGKIINKIIEETGVKIDIEQDGTVFIASTNLKPMNVRSKLLKVSFVRLSSVKYMSERLNVSRSSAASSKYFRIKMV